MSRLARYPLEVPAGIKVDCDGKTFSASKANTNLKIAIHPEVKVEIADNKVQVSAVEAGNRSKAIVGTIYALIRNTLTGIADGYEKKLLLQGVGYRAAVKGQNIELLVGYSNPVNFAVPAGVSVSSPSATEIVLQSADKQLVGQVAAQIRAVRKPDPYKGKGIRYSDEQLKLKEVTKKK